MNESFAKELAKEYLPYNTLPEFWEGFSAYGKTWVNPHDGYKAQAWDRGLECAMRCLRRKGEYQANVWVKA